MSWCDVGHPRGCIARIYCILFVSLKKSRKKDIKSIQKTEKSRKSSDNQRRKIFYNKAQQVLVTTRKHQGNSLKDRRSKFS